jgi:hypothetical protein
MLAVRDCLFNLFAATLHIGGPSAIRNLRMRHAVVKETHLSHGLQKYFFKIHFNIILPLMAMTYKKSLPFRIAILISRGIWHTHYGTKQEIVNCNLTISLLRQLMA